MESSPVVNKKFARSMNFSVKEEGILLSLVKKYKDTIECKKSDTNTNKIKFNAWLQLSKEFNAICGENFRDVKILKNKYENIKKRTKQKFADQKKYITGTGGGPEMNILVTRTDNEIIDIIGTQITGRTSEFDEDAVAEVIELSTPLVSFLESNESVIGSMDSIIHENEETENEIPLLDAKSVHSTSDWRKATPTLLRTPKSKCLQVPKSLASQRLTDWTESKVKTLETQQNCLTEEHNLKMQHMKKIHQQQMIFSEEEHKLKMEILTLEKQMMFEKLNQKF